MAPRRKNPVPPAEPTVQPMKAVLPPVAPPDIEPPPARAPEPPKPCLGQRLLTSWTVWVCGYAPLAFWFGVDALPTILTLVNLPEFGQTIAKFGIEVGPLSAYAKTVGVLTILTRVRKELLAPKGN
jgi:hypothetical protein